MQIDTSQYFREMKAKKAKFGFQGSIVGTEKSIITTAEVLKSLRATYPDLNIVIDSDKRTVTVYTDAEDVAKTIRDHHCWKTL